MSQRSPAYERFLASTEIGSEQWHDGIGYDLDALGQLTGEERGVAEAWLVGRADRDWRDVEALVALGTETALEAVRRVLRTGSIELRLAAARALPDDPVIEAEREAAIVAGLGEATAMGGLSRALDLAAEHRSPAVIDALFRATLRDDREMAVNAAALLAFIHGTAKEAFDWDRRPFYLHFGEADPAVRRAAFEQLCRECGVDPAKYLKT